MREKKEKKEKKEKIVKKRKLESPLEYADINTPLFSLNGLNCPAKIVDNYDGDTCDIVIILNTAPTRFKCRLNGIDCAEIRSKDSDEKSHAIRAKEFVKNWHNDTIIWAKFHRFDKFGRVLADLYLSQDSETSLSDLLIQNNLAYKYSGEKKKKFKDWVKNIFNR